MSVADFLRDIFSHAQWHSFKPFIPATKKKKLGIYQTPTQFSPLFAILNGCLIAFVVPLKTRSYIPGPDRATAAIATAKLRWYSLYLSFPSLSI